MKTHLSLIALTVSLASCGSKSSSDSASSSISNATADSAGTTVADQTTQALAENPTSSANLVADSDITVTRACTSNTPATGDVEVVWNRSGTGTKTVTRGKWTIVHTMTASGTETRDWVPPTGQTISCTAKSYAGINWSNTSLVNGLKLTSTITNRIHNMSVSRTNSKTNATSTVTHNNTTNGTRSVTWSNPTVTAGTSTTTITLTKSITLNTTTTSTSTAVSGTDVTTTATVATDSSAPLSITVTRSGTTASGTTIQSKSVDSGTIIHTDAAGIVTKSAFAKVVYDLSSTSSNKCIPTGGTITGSIYASATATTATKTFVINFNDTTVDSGISISYDGGSAQDYNYSNEGCDLAHES